MKLGIKIQGLLVLLLMVPLAGCLTDSDSGVIDGTQIDLVPLTPDEYACSPLQNDDSILASHYGVHGELYYLTKDQPRYRNVLDYILNGLFVDLDLFFNQINIHTRPFDRGFVTAGGNTIVTAEGDTLYEYFALRLRGRLVSGGMPEGLYQVALLSDDGSILDMDFGSGMQEVVNNDGQHPTRMGCGMAPVHLSQQPIPFELNYNQGPRYHIALMVMVRPWPENGDPNDPQCGKYGNSMYFNSQEDPPRAAPAYDGLLERGWRPLEPQNYLLPLDKIQNPCSVPAPVISNFAIASVTSTSVTLTWETDLPSTSQVLHRLGSASDFISTPQVAEGRTLHEVTVSGLAPNTNYSLKAVSTSYSGLSSESGELAVRTRR